MPTPKQRLRGILRRPRSGISILLVLTIALLTAGIGVAAGPAQPAAAAVLTANGTSFNYSYSGSITTSDCTNPARGADYYGDFFKVSGPTSIALYMGNSSFDDFIQILSSDRRDIIAQDDDSGQLVGLDSFLNYGGSLSTSEYIVATSFSPGTTGSYTLYSTQPLTQVTNCPQVTTMTVEATAQYGNNINVTASTNMELPVTLTSQTPSVCSVTASNAPNFTVAALNIGTCTLLATQAGNGSVEAADNITRNITITARQLTLTGLSASKDYDGLPSVTVNGTPAIGNVVNGDDVQVTGSVTGTFVSANAGTTQVNVSGLSLTGSDAPLYRLPASINGTINRIASSVSWSPSAIFTPSQTGTTLAAATTTGGGAITYSVVNAGTTGCSISGRVLSFSAEGSCQLRAAAAQTTNYLASTANATVTISKLNQVVTWTPTTSISANSTTQAFSAATTSGNGSISYTVVNAGSTGCTVSGTSLSFTTVGTCRVRAAAASTTDYNPATLEVDFVISRVTQTVTWVPTIVTGLATAGRIIPDLAATSNGGGIITYSVASAGSTGCRVDSSSGEVTFATAGTCRVRATAAETDVASAGSAEVDFQVGLAPQTLTWTPVTSVTSTAAGTLTPSSAAIPSGGGAVRYTLAAQSGSGCSVDSSTGAIRYSDSGTCTVTASVESNGVYATASTSVTFTFTVNRPATRGVSAGIPVVMPRQLPSAAPVSIRPVGTPLISSSGNAGPVTITDSGLPKLTPAQSVSVEGGKSVAVVLQPKPRESVVSVLSDEFTVDLSAITVSGSPVPLGDNSTLTLLPGAKASVSGSGFKPNSTVRVWLFSTPTLLGTVTTNADGDFEGSVEVMAALVAGEHTLQLEGIAKSGAVRTVSVGVVVDADATAAEIQSGSAADEGQTEPGNNSAQTVVEDWSQTGVGTAAIVGFSALAALGLVVLTTWLIRRNRD